MKNFFEILGIMVLTFMLFIPMQLTVRATTYANMGTKKDVVINKPWTINFNNPLSTTTVNSSNIKVLEENNKYIGIKVSLTNNNKSVIVEPVKNYEYNKVYTLIVTVNVKSSDGSPLPKEVRMDFNTESEPVLKIYSVQDIAANLAEGETYTFPKIVQATLGNNSKKELAVEWLQDFVNLNKSGTYIYEGTIKNYDKKVKAIIVVGKKQTSKFIVCINAARGGSDSGVIGPTGLKEKDVNLDIALRLGKLLEKENLQVIYTRSGDTVTWNSTNDIQERINIANNANSDLLITISCNSFGSEAVNGIETYYFKGNEKGKQLAEYIQTQLVSKTSATDRGAKDSELNSLRISKAPAAMAVIGFITNKTEESKLGTSEYKDKLALAFAEAVKKYVTANPKYNYKVVLDAGHGGADPGAIGAAGTEEKSIALAVTLKIGDILAKNGVESIYTRTTDNVTWSTNETQNLQARCDISNMAEVKYFVSIHGNSYSNPEVSGIETYYFKGSATGEKLAQAVQTELIKETGRIDRKVKTAGYYVLKNVDATAILIEIAFLSNPEEEMLVITEEYQNKLAKAISTGILKSLGISNITY